MSRQLLGRRQFLRESMPSLAGLAIVAAGLDPLDRLFPARAAAEELAPGTICRATGFYEKTALGHETLVALVLVPVNGAETPSVQQGTSLERRDLGAGPLETFQGLAGGMQRKLLLDHGAPQAVIYSVKTLEGAYAEEKRYLFGRSQLDIENPGARARRGQGLGNDGGNGGNSGGGMM